ncbi:MAG: alpha/beta hydrolase [Sedimentisphaerales bacterium]|nr:alpha/beta hydrolase [Sedimentisphaerales bacterium]
MWPELAYFVGMLLLAYLGWAATLYCVQSRLLYRPVREVLHSPEELGLYYEDITFKSKDGLTLNGWWVPAGNSMFTVLFCHGNGGNITHRLDSISILNKLGLSCFIFDYRGYGNSEGTPSEEGTYLDALAAYNWLAQTKKIRKERIIVFGRSLGGSVAAQLAATVRVGGVVIESSFTSYADIAARFCPYMPVRRFARFSYRTLDYIKEIHCPVLIIHSRNDEVVPFEFGVELYEAANEPKEFVEILGDHNDGFLVARELYNDAWAKWVRFLAEKQD